MDLVEAFGARGNLGHGGLEYMERVESGASGDLVIIDPPTTSNAGASEGPQLSIDTAIRQASRGRGSVTCVTASNDVVLVATARGYLLRYGWDENGNEKVGEVEVVPAKQQSDHRIAALFMDPWANHVLVAVRGNPHGAGGAAGFGPSEVYYVHRRWPRARALAELRPVGPLTAVAWWPKQGGDDPASAPGGGAGGGGGGGGRGAASSVGSAASDSYTGPILLGTETGCLLEMVLDERQKKEAPPKMLIEGVVAPKDRKAAHAASLPPPPGSPSPAFTSLYQVALPGGRKALLAATPSHLRLWVTPPALPPPPPGAPPASAAGGGTPSTWQAFFHGPNHGGPHHGGGSVWGGGGATTAAAAPPPPPVAVLEAVAPSPYSQLQLWWPAGLTDLPSRFAWLVGGVVHHGELNWEAAVAVTAAQGAEAAGPAADAAAAAGGMAGGGGRARGGGRGGGGEEVLSGVVSLPLVVVAEKAKGDGATVGGGGAGAGGGGGGGPSDGGGARGLVLTEYHLLLLAGDQLRLVNRVDGRTVAMRELGSPLTRSVTGEPSREIDGLVRDHVSGTTYMAVDEALYDVSVLHETRGMWRVYLELQDWDAALRCCSGPSQRDEVHRARAEAAVAAGDYLTAAVHFAKITDGRPPFEDVALQLADCGDPGALRAFLATRLAALAATLGAAGARGGGAAAAAASAAVFGEAGGGGGGGPGASHPSPQLVGGPERAQCTLVSAWLTELHLDAINRALLEAGGEAGESYQSAVTALRTHLSDWLQVMDPGTTVSLLASYGRLDELLELARLRNDHEGLLEQLMARPQPGGALEALKVLRRPGVSRELVYKFAPGLVAAAPEEAVTFFVKEPEPLDPRRLLPALLRYGEPDSAPTARRHVLRYIEFAIQELRTTDSVVHNLAVALYSLAPGPEGEDALLRYLTRAGRGGANLTYGGTAPLYDTQYALRLAQECSKPRAAVRLMCQLGMYPDAVRAALALDLGLAKSVAGEPDQDDALRRKLWLQVARHVVESGSKVAEAAAAAAAANAAASAAAAAGAGAGAGAGAAASAAASAAAGAADPTAHIRTAVNFLREADGLLRIEDILPFFPDFATIDNFQAAICDSLERYGAAIEGLKSDMEEATAIAEAIRADIGLLANRSAVVSMSQPCTRCGRPISEAAPLTSLPQGGALPAFYLFPTGCAYHLACCAAEVTDLVSAQQRKRIHTLMARLSRVRPGATTAPAYGGSPAAEVSELQEALAAEIGAEDPRNGEITVRLLETPFVYDTDRAEAETWVI